MQEAVDHVGSCEMTEFRPGFLALGSTVAAPPGLAQPRSHGERGQVPRSPSLSQLTDPAARPQGVDSPASRRASPGFAHKSLLLSSAPMKDTGRACTWRARVCVSLCVCIVILFLWGQRVQDALV